MKICVLDLELNKPSKKIIEIGAVCLDVKSGKILNTFQCYVDPQEPIDEFITQLTGITDNDILGAPKINYALDKLWAWMHLNGCAKTVGAWGSDWHLIFNECKKHGINYEHPKHLDIKVMGMVLRCSFPHRKVESGLQKTLELFGLSFNGKPHQALCDAENTARLLYRFKQMTEVYNQINDLIKNV